MTTPWRAYLIETVTGRIGSEVEMSTNGRWDITLNGNERMTVTVQKSSLAAIPRKWLTPWRNGFLLTFTGHDLIERPMLAGPITAPPDEYPESLSFTVGGIRSILEHRILVSRGYNWSPGLTNAQHVDRLKKQSVVYKDTSLGYIAQDIVRIAMDKRGGSLPIQFMTNPEKTVKKGHQRTYPGYDFQNNEIDKRLNELSDVENGPDIMFRPRYVDDSKRNYLYWGMYTGTHASPVIAQSWRMSVDTTAPYSNISEVSIGVDGEHYATRQWATGAGEGAGIAATMSEDLSILQDDYPLLESTIAYPSVKTLSVLDGHARAAVSRKPKIELYVTMDVREERAMLGRWHVGDKAEVTTHDYFALAPGTHDMRITRAAGDFDSPHATVYFQEDEW